MDIFDVLDLMLEEREEEALEKLDEALSEKDLNSFEIEAKEAVVRILLKRAKEDPDRFIEYLIRELEETSYSRSIVSSSDLDSELLFLISDFCLKRPDLASPRMVGYCNRSLKKCLSDFEGLLYFSERPQELKRILSFIVSDEHSDLDEVYLEAKKASLFSRGRFREAARKVFETIREFVRKKGISLSLSIDLLKQKESLGLLEKSFTEPARELYVTVRYQFLNSLSEEDFDASERRQIRERIGPAYDLFKKKELILLSQKLYEAGSDLRSVSVLYPEPVRRGAFPRTKTATLKSILKKPSLQPEYGPLASAWLIFEKKRELKKKGVSLRLESEGFDWTLTLLLSGHRPPQKSLRPFLNEFLKRDPLGLGKLLSSMERQGLDSKFIVRGLDQSERVQALSALKASKPKTKRLL